MGFFKDNFKLDFTGTANMNFSGSSNQEDPSSAENSGKNSKNQGTVLALVIIILIYFVFAQFFGDSRLTWSSVEREPLEGTTMSADLYTDLTESYITSSTDLTEGMSNFFAATGISAYIYILEDDSSLTSADSLSETAQSLYDELFDDEYHLLVLVCSNTEEFFFAYAYGDEAAALLNEDETIPILDECINHYFDKDDIAYSLSSGIESGGNHIMQTSGNFGTIIIILAIIIAAMVFAYFGAKKRKALRQDTKTGEQ